MPGPQDGPGLFREATSPDVLSLCRLWLDDRLPRKRRGWGPCSAGPSRDAPKAVLPYADPGIGHEGHINRGAGWLFLGESETPRVMSLNGAPPKHLRTMGPVLHTPSAEYLWRQASARMIPTTPRFLYARILDLTSTERMLRQPLPYPSGGEKS
jgi:hypothetical protein